jgi:hypothetical protein
MINVALKLFYFMLQQRQRLVIFSKPRELDPLPLLQPRPKKARNKGKK